MDVILWCSETRGKCDHPLQLNEESSFVDFTISEVRGLRLETSTGASIWQERSRKMPLSVSSPTYSHILQNISLIALSLLFTPLCFFIGTLSHLISPLTSARKHIQHRRQWRVTSSLTFRPRVILVTGVGMSKGLTIARAFYRAGHIVIGADFEPNRIPVCGRFSKCLKMFYRLPKPIEDDASDYMTSLVQIIKREKVEVWISCSGVASAIEDAEAAESVRRLTKCEPIQFGVSLTKTLHEKHSFIEKTKELGLNVPETHYITSMGDAVDVLSQRGDGMKFIMKSVGLDDSIRADMSLLPRDTESETRKALTKLRISRDRPFVLQEFVRGPEFCTHSVVIRGEVVIFTACPSAELLMHYKALDSRSELFQAMLSYTKAYCKGIHEEMTGHFSMDFLLNENSCEPDLMQQLYPIECNPRAHTAVVLISEQEAMAEAYLRVLDTEPSEKPVLSNSEVGYFWVGHDVVTR